MEQRLAFDQVADVYKTARPGYPEALVEHVVAYAELKQNDKILEIGCGTGQATKSSAAGGRRKRSIQTEIPRHSSCPCRSEGAAIPPRAPKPRTGVPRRRRQASTGWKGKFIWGWLHRRSRELGHFN